MSFSNCRFAEDDNTLTSRSYKRFCFTNLSKEYEHHLRKKNREEESLP